MAREQVREGPARGRRLRGHPRPGVALVTGFGVLSLLGAGLLMLPISSASGAWTAPVVALFTSVSSVCVTGLVVVDTGTYWSPFGQVVVLGLVQVGGFGFMSGSTLLLLLLVGRSTSLHGRIEAQETLGVRDLGSVRPVLRRVAVFTVVVEVAGWLVLGGAFLARYGDPATAAWYGLFHTVSAFNNAGMDLIGGFRGFIDFAGDPSILVPTGVLIFLGGLGAAIVGDVVGKRHWSRLALESKLVLATSVALIVVGTGLLLAFEMGNPATLGGMPAPEAVLNALFQSTALRSGGIASIPIGELSDPSQLTSSALMFIGGASGSTAGGIKVTTFAILLAAVIATVRGRPFAEAFGRRLREADLSQALSVALVSIAFVFLLILGLELTAGDRPFLALVFEAASAFGTVGYSVDVTPGLSDPALLVLSVGMFVGRLGPLTLVLALSARSRPVAYRPAVESIRIG